MSEGRPGFVPALASAVASAVVSDAARGIARASMLDTAACISAGWASPEAIGAQQAHRSVGAAGAGAVALRLGTAAHALDYDDYEEPGSTHPSAVLVPVILGISTCQDIAIAQAEVAYVLGYRAILALGRSMGYGHYIAGWHATSTLGTVGAAVCAASLLQVPPERLAHVISLAMTQASGLKVQFGFGAKAVHAGLAARNGIEAAALAAEGVTGAPGAYEGGTGFAALFEGARHPYETLPKIEDFPPWRKLSPSCGYTLRAIDAACELAAHGLDPTMIKGISVKIADAYAKVAPYRAPTTPAEARFSVAWCVAAGLVDGRVEATHFDQKALVRADLRALEEKVEIALYPLPAGLGDMAAKAPDTVEVQLANGTLLQATCATPRGAPDRPLSEAEFTSKLLNCRLDLAKVQTFKGAGGDKSFTLASLLPSHVLEGV